MKRRSCVCILVLLVAVVFSGCGGPSRERTRAYDPDAHVAVAGVDYALAAPFEGEERRFLAWLSEGFSHPHPKDATPAAVMVFERPDQAGPVAVTHLTFEVADTEALESGPIGARWFQVRTRVLHGVSQVQDIESTRAPTANSMSGPSPSPSPLVLSAASFRSRAVSASGLLEARGGELGGQAWLELDEDGIGHCWGTMGGECKGMRRDASDLPTPFFLYHTRRAGALVSIDRVEVMLTADTEVVDSGRTLGLLDYPFPEKGYVGFSDYVPVRADLELREGALHVNSLTILGPAGERPKDRALRLLRNE